MDIQSNSISGRLFLVVLAIDFGTASFWRTAPMSYSAIAECGNRSEDALGNAKLSLRI